MKLFFVLTLLFTGFFISKAQNSFESEPERKTITTTRFEGTIKIDGILDDLPWQNAPLADGFIERSPTMGLKQPLENATSVKILYDDTAIYFGIEILHPDPKNIAREMTERDVIGEDDLIGITLNGYNDYQQSLLFLILASGVQADAKIVNNRNDDYSWNAVWFSKVKITEKGWNAEIKIPFSELRFPKKDVQTWGINFLNNLRSNQSQYTWSPIDNNKGSFMYYDGQLKGIENIDPPTRLSFLPYFSSYVNSYNGKTTTSINGGMDLKYGLNEAFTLDVTLIPDFGQANFDNVVLNLGPFEQQYEENRSFFTEGTELFNKGDLFYSRRVGGAPSGGLHLGPDEITTTQSEKVNLFNAIKLSGRTKKGLGIGLFNGVTEKLEVEIENPLTNQKRKETIEPWSNYNVLVLDQRFHENSSVTLVNTNVTREGSFRDANVTALMADLSNRKNTHNLFASYKQSVVNQNKYYYGSEASLGGGKTAGAHRYSLDALVRTKDYNIDDLGYTGGNNYVNYHGFYGYRYLMPKGNLNQLNYNLNLNLSYRLEPYQYREFDIHQSISLTNRKFQNYGIGLWVKPFGGKDMYEPRSFGRHLNVPAMVNPWIFYNSDSRKKFGVGGFTEIYVYDQPGRIRYVSEINTSYRFSDQFSVGYEFDYDIHLNDIGYVSSNAENITMGRRNVRTFVNEINSRYTFNDKMSLSLDFRHYLSSLKYDQFYHLRSDGDLNSIHQLSQSDATYNFWNIDLRYSWWFAPGSQLTLLFRNATSSFQDHHLKDLNANFRYLFDKPMLNTLSLKLTYYLDYNRAKQFLKRK